MSLNCWQEIGRRRRVCPNGVHAQNGRGEACFLPTAMPMELAEGMCAHEAAAGKEEGVLWSTQS